jgi:hypothetical protein
VPIGTTHLTQFWTRNFFAHNARGQRIALSLQAGLSISLQTFQVPAFRKRPW